MTDGIVDRLRDDYQKTPELCAEAADEIERQDKEIERLKTILDFCCSVYSGRHKEGNQ